MSPQILPTNPTEEEIERAFDILSRAAQVRKAAGITDPGLLAFRAQQQKNRDLAAQCDQLQDPIFQRLATALPDDLKELFQLYGLMMLAPYTVTQESFRVFRSSHRRAKKLLALQS